MKRIITIASIAAALTGFAPSTALAQSVHSALQGNARYQCSQELQWNARSSVAPVASSAFWYAASFDRAVIAFEQKPSTPGPWQQVQATNCTSGRSQTVWTRKW